MTNGWIDIKNTDMMLIMGDNPAENHPCGFKWPVEAKLHRNAWRSLAQLAEVVKRICSWDATLESVSAEAAIYEAWIARLPAALFGPQLGPRVDLHRCFVGTS